MLKIFALFLLPICQLTFANSESCSSINEHISTCQRQAVIEKTQPQKIVSTPKCLKQRTKVEKLICNDNQLSKKDSDMTKAIKKAFKKVPSNQKVFLEVGQDSWLEERNKCKNKACLLKSYNNRLDDLEYINTNY